MVSLLLKAGPVDSLRLRDFAERLLDTPGEYARLLKHTAADLVLWRRTADSELIGWPSVQDALCSIDAARLDPYARGKLLRAALEARRLSVLQALIQDAQEDATFLFKSAFAIRPRPMLEWVERGGARNLPPEALACALQHEDQEIRLMALSLLATLRTGFEGQRPTPRAARSLNSSR